MRKGEKMDKIKKELSGDLKVPEARAEMMMRMMNKIDELIEGYNKIMKRLDKDMEHDEVMDDIIMKTGEELADHLNSHINLVKDGLRKEKNQ